MYTIEMSLIRIFVPNFTKKNKVNTVRRLVFFVFTSEKSEHDFFLVHLLSLILIEVNRSMDLE